MATGETVTHVEAAARRKPLKSWKTSALPRPTTAPSVTRVDIDVATGETEVTITESPADDLDDEEAQVLEAVADGVVTPAEAEELKSEAGRILAEVAQDTPDSPAPRRAYGSSAEISARIRELCDDPDELQELLARARADAAEAAQETRMAKQNRGDGDGDGNTVTESAASAAADVLAQARRERSGQAPDGTEQGQKVGHGTAAGGDGRLRHGGPGRACAPWRWPASWRRRAVPR